MNGILTKLVVSIISTGLVASALAASQRTADPKGKELHLSHAKRLHPKSDGDIKVDCADPKKKASLSAVLAGLNPSGAYIIRVSGACQDNINIIGFTDITLIAEPGASITDASGGINPVINVERTVVYEMQGFTINGQAVSCGDFSTCFFSGNTIQDSPEDGVLVDQSNADFVGDLMQRNSVGIGARFDSVVAMDSVSLLNNAGFGAFFNFGSSLLGSNLTVQNNGGQGLRISTKSLLSIVESNVSNNGDDGIFVQVGSEGYFSGNTITGNTQAGVRVRDLSMVVFPGGSNVTGNLGGTDVVCEGQFAAARDTATSINGGTTNCTPE